MTSTGDGASLNVEWALVELRKFIGACDAYQQAWNRKGDWQGAEQLVQEQIPVVVRIIDRVTPGQWRRLTSQLHINKWGQARNAAAHAITLLERRAELEENLGEAGPQLAATSLHPVVWDAAKSLWRSEHRGEAVQVAAKSVNGYLQQRLGRRDVSEAKAVQQAFSLEPPAEGRPRLRLIEDDGGDTFKSLHVGASSFGAGCFQALRNPGAHEVDASWELAPQEALEHLAAFSILARWIEQAELITV